MCNVNTGSNGVNGENAFYGYVERKNIFMTSDFSAGHNRDINIVKTDDNWISNSLYNCKVNFISKQTDIQQTTILTAAKFQRMSIMHCWMNIRFRDLPMDLMM